MVVCIKIGIWGWHDIHPGSSYYPILTHWGRVTYICVGKLTIIGSDNGLSPGRRQAIIRTNAGILLIGILGTNFSEIFNGIYTFALKKMHLKMSSGRWRPFCGGLNEIRACIVYTICCPLNSQKTPHTSPFRASYGVSFMSTSTEIDRVIKGFYCTTCHAITSVAVHINHCWS